MNKKLYYKEQVNLYKVIIAAI